MREKIIKWLGIDSINQEIQQIQETIYDKDSMTNGFAIPKIIDYSLINNIMAAHPPRKKRKKKK